MCAALFNHKFADQFSTSASSAGIFTDGAPINHKSVTALLEKGVISSNFNPYNDHISHSVTESDIIESDLVYGVTEQHSAHLKLMFPEHADKIFSLPIQISDPFGKDIYEYKRCLNDIDKALGILFEARQNNMYDITISFALLNDLQEILEIENDSFSSPWSEKSLFDAIRSKNIAVYVAKNNEKKQAQRKKQIKANIENPNFDEDEYIDITCANCKAELSFTKGQLQSGEELTCPMCDAHLSV